MSVPRVSVIIPTYRRADYLQRAMESVIAQTMQDWELIVVDDNEPDSRARSATSDVVASFAGDERVRVVWHKRNRGGAAARNSGVRQARAEFVAFLDDDDVWHPAKLERQIQRFATGASTLGLVYSRARYVRLGAKDDVISRPTRAHSVRDLLIRNTLGTTSCVMCRRDALVSVGLFDAGLPARQDQDLFLRLAQLYTFELIDEVLVTVHEHDRGRISTDFDAAVVAHEHFFEKYRSLIESDAGVRHALLMKQGKNLTYAGRYVEARRVLIAAWRSQPLDARALARIAMTYTFSRHLVQGIRHATARVARGRRH